MPDPDFSSSKLWRMSAYETYRTQTGQVGFIGADGDSTLASTLRAELTTLERSRRAGDALQVVAACVRCRESALILLRQQGKVWPLTLFPREGLYQLPRGLDEMLEAGSRDLEVLTVGPPGLRPPGHSMHERIAKPASYHALPPLLWDLALHAPRVSLLDDISGPAAYRVSAVFHAEGMKLAGALAPVLQRLRRDIASLDELASWPGMSRERAARLLNAVYLQGGLIVLRTHRAAQEGYESRLRRWFKLSR
jgi:hypothetical protein